MRAILNDLVQFKTLDRATAKQIILNLNKGAYNQAQLASFMTIFMMRHITLEELLGFRDAFLELCVPIDLSSYNTIDLCGTGGDGKDTFNISTLASFVVASTGIPVSKHGNYGLSSISGSSNVLELLGIKFSNKEEDLKRQLDHANICVLHAPLFHPAMKNVGQLRKDLAVKTFFNCLGPLVNPCKPKHQIIGVYALELARMLTYTLQDTTTNFAVVHSLDGYDEVSLTGKTKIYTNRGEFLLGAEDFGTNYVQAQDLTGGKTKEEAAAIFMNILNGKGTATQNQVVCANAALAIHIHTGCSIQEGFKTAEEHLLQLKAKATFEKFKQICQ
ncbi:MAG: anthranilate phosphoribosyltransferase [Flavobacterium sp.]|nr:anthranilate phosphoribosyltransferase [Candidatus Neoflavobacterium equi]